MQQFAGVQASGYDNRAVASIKIGDILTARQAMLLAIHESQKGWGHVSPNPLVGCVILDAESRLVSTGYHAQYGGPHAEINALEKISVPISGQQLVEKIKGALVFVTLEPCAHQGKTGSCAITLSKLPIKKVVFGLVDPNPLVSGKGQQILRDSGVECELYQDLDKAFQQKINSLLEFSCEHFLKNFRQQKPFIALKIAASLDGQLAAADGSSRWITDEKAREYVHYLRAGFDAILMGSGTLLRDDPRMTIRHPQFPHLKNRKIILLDSKGVLNQRQDWNLLKEHTSEDILWFTTLNPAEVNPGLKVRPLPYVGRNLNAVLTDVWHRGVKSIFVETGSILLNLFIKYKTFDRLYLFQAPMILGAKSGYSWTSQVTISSMEQGFYLHIEDSKTFERTQGGVDLFTSLIPL